MFLFGVRDLLCLHYVLSSLILAGGGGVCVGMLGVHKFSHCDFNYTWFIAFFWYLNCVTVLFQGVIDGTDYGHDFATKSRNVLQELAIYPERPDELECSHYMKHGYCKYKMNCKFHHPRDRLPKK